jgi:lipopolysaccharide transport system permease protein
MTDNKPLPIKTYKRQNKAHIFKMTREMLSDLWASHFLAYQFAKRDITSQYRQSYLGVFWMFLTPVASAVVWIFLNNSGTVSVPDTGIPYPVYVFSGTLIWSIISESINSPTISTNASRSILTKINFPKEALVLSGVYKLLFNSSIKVVLLIALVFIFGVGFHWTLLFFPLALLCTVMVGTAIGLCLTPIGLLYNDISRIVTAGLPILMYLTPVVYGISSEDGIMKAIMTYNPFTPLVMTTRDLAVGQTPEFLTYFICLSLASVVLLILSLLIFRLSIPVIVERLSA